MVAPRRSCSAVTHVMDCTMETNKRTDLPDVDPDSAGSRLSRLTGEDPAKTQPSHIRGMGIYGLFAAVALVGLNVYSLTNDGRIWPKTVLMIPTLFLLGLWMLVDANALATNRRRFTPILWACMAVGSAVGLGAIKFLTGHWF
jgi:hypothetical protein